MSESEKPKVGMPAVYRSLSHGFYPCRVVKVRESTVVDVEIEGADNLVFTKLPWWDGERKDCPKRGVMERENG